MDARLYPELARATGGVPRRINQIMARLLLLGAIEQSGNIDGAMLDTVLADLARDAAAPVPAQVAAPLPEAAAIAFPAKQERHPEPELPLAVPAAAALVDIQAALAARDTLIAELQEAVIELSQAGEHVPAALTGADHDHLLSLLGGLEARINGIEGRLFEQEQTLRHTLTMIIEMVEDDEQHRRAA
jgi:hypothetical protein